MPSANVTLLVLRPARSTNPSILNLLDVILRNQTDITPTIRPVCMADQLSSLIFSCSFFRFQAILREKYVKVELVGRLLVVRFFC